MAICPMSRVFANEPDDQGWIQGWAKLKTQKTLLALDYGRQLYAIHIWSSLKPIKILHIK